MSAHYSSKAKKPPFPIRDLEGISVDEYWQRNEAQLTKQGLTRVDLIAFQHDDITQKCAPGIAALKKKTLPLEEAQRLLFLALDGFVYPDRSTLEGSLSVLELFSSKEATEYWDAVFHYPSAYGRGYPEQDSLIYSLVIDYDLFERKWEPEPGCFSSDPHRFGGIIPFCKKAGYADLYSRAVALILRKAESDFSSLLPLLISLVNFSLLNDMALREKIMAIFEKAALAGFDCDQLVRNDGDTCNAVILREDHHWTTIREAVSGIPLHDAEGLKATFQNDRASLYDLEAYHDKNRTILFEHGVRKDDLIAWQHEALLARCDRLLSSLKTLAESPEKMAAPLTLQLVGYCCPDWTCLLKVVPLFELLASKDYTAYWDALFKDDPLPFCGDIASNVIQESLVVDFHVFERPRRPILGLTGSVSEHFSGWIRVARSYDREDLILQMGQALIKKGPRTFSLFLPTLISLRCFFEGTWDKDEQLLLDQMASLALEAQAQGFDFARPLGTVCAGLSVREPYQKKTLASFFFA
jgi:hypothetical protein